MLLNLASFTREVSMSVAGISSVISALYQLGQSNGPKQVPSEFRQLGQDLSSGNLTAAQTDYSTLAQSLSPNQSGGTNSVAQAFNQLGQDLRSGNLGAAQQDFSQVQQDVQQASSLHGHGHHHHRVGGTLQDPTTSSSPQTSDAASLFAELGQSLQSGNLSAAQQAYSTLQQDFLQFSATASTNLATQSNVSGLNLNA
ncbi:MAG TPA: hypothetical protein VMH85_07635 [Terriglobales bacterium]|nr:hypothetical protein [Terriglobales bacterium]